MDPSFTQSERTGQPWYVVQTRPGCERSSAAVLTHKAYDVFLPEQRRKMGQTCRVAPLFPSYLFCRSAAQSFGLIVTTPGILRLLGLPGKPEPVPDDEVEGVRRLVAANRPARVGGAIRVGQKVRIEKGPLRGVLGYVVGEAAGRRLAVSVELLQRSISIALDPVWLESDVPVFHALPPSSGLMHLRHTRQVHVEPEP